MADNYGGSQTCGERKPKASILRVGVFAETDADAARLADLLRFMGGEPQDVRGYHFLRRSALAGVDRAIVSISDSKDTGELSVAARQFLDILVANLSSNSGFSAVVMTPRSLASAVKKICEGCVVTLLVDPTDRGGCSSVLELMRSCAPQSISTAIRLTNIDRPQARQGNDRALVASVDSHAKGNANLSAKTVPESLPSPAVAATRPQAEQSPLARDKALLDLANQSLESLANSGLGVLDIVDQLSSVASKIDTMLERFPDITESGEALPAGRDSGFKSDLPCAGAGCGSLGSNIASNPPPNPAFGAMPMGRVEFLRGIIAGRQIRSKAFGKGLFGDPAWEMILDLALARAENKQVSVSSLCIASGTPHTTALRWISKLVDAGLFVRVEDEHDKRRVFIVLSDKAIRGLDKYFEQTEYHPQIKSIA